MGKPAARLLDPTAHGGMIMGPGCPTVLIGKMPAATLGDTHVCPMCTPGTPPIPHVGGPITLGSTGVFIGKKPAARLGDWAVCVGPPSSIVMGCPTVLIGEAGSGFQAGSAGAAATAASAQSNGVKAIEPFLPPEPPQATEPGHVIHALAQDGAGLPIGGIAYEITDPDRQTILATSSPDGTITHGGYAKAGSYDLKLRVIQNARWDKPSAKVGDTLEFQADAEGFASGEEADFMVFGLDPAGNYRLILLAKVPVNGTSIEKEWKVERLEEFAAGDANAGLAGVFAMVSAGGQVAITAEVPLLADADIALFDGNGKPIAGAGYCLTLIDGSVRSGKLDGNGKASEKDIPYGPYRVEFKDYPAVNLLASA